MLAPLFEKDAGEFDLEGYGISADPFISGLNEVLLPVSFDNKGFIRALDFFSSSYRDFLVPKSKIAGYPNIITSLAYNPKDNELAVLTNHNVQSLIVKPYSQIFMGKIPFNFMDGDPVLNSRLKSLNPVLGFDFKGRGFAFCEIKVLRIFLKGLY